MRKADNFTTILGHCHVIWNLNFLEPCGHLWPVTGLLYLYLYHKSILIIIGVKCNSAVHNL